MLITNLKLKKNVVQVKGHTSASYSGLRSWFSALAVEWGWVGSLRNGTPPGAGGVTVRGDDFREVMTLELGS